MAAPGAVAGLELLGRVGLEDVLLPELAAARGMAQNRFHDRDVHGHILAAVQAAIDLRADPGPAVGDDLAPAVRALLAEPLADDLDRGGALRWAALLHDIAKPPTRAERPDGRVTFIGHDGLGADMARACSRACGPRRGCAPTSPRSRAITCTWASSCTSARSPAGRSTATSWRPTRCPRT
jgi:putative nucleotidyltransferase with HDIG domain